MEVLDKLPLNKHIATIHCSNNISLLQRKIYNVLLYNAYDRLLENDFHSISLSDLAKTAGYNSKDIKKLKNAFRGLQETIVEWNILEHSKRSKIDTNDVIWCSSSLLASTEINPKTSTCVYEFSKKLADLLYQPDVYARIDLNIQKRFKSNYTLALYENCLRFKRIKTTGWISYPDFRKLMGVSENKYKSFCDFNRRVLSIAVKEVNKSSDIEIHDQIKRVSQKVVAIRFTIETSSALKSKILPPGDTSSENNKRDIEGELVDRLCYTFNASKESSNKIVKQYGHDYIKEKIDLVLNMSIYKSGTVKSPIALLKSALVDNYKADQANISSSSSPASSKPSQQQQMDYNDFLVSETMKLFAGLPERERGKLLESFEYYMVNSAKLNLSWSVVLKVYRSSGLSSVKRELCEFLTNEYPTVLSALPKIDRYLNNDEIASE